MKLSGSIASGNLKLGLGRYGVISAFGRKEVANFTFTPSLVGNYQENIVVENVLDARNDQNVIVKAAVRKLPAFTVDSVSLDFGTININSIKLDDHQTNNHTKGSIPPLTFTLTNVSKLERSFILEVIDHLPSNASSHSSSSSTSASPPVIASPSSSYSASSQYAPLDSEVFAQISLGIGGQNTATVLSQIEEEEVEALSQKLKIARRKGKVDKIAKYVQRLGELGASIAEPESESADSVGSTLTILDPSTTSSELGKLDPEESSRSTSPLPIPVPSKPISAEKMPISSLSVLVPPNQKQQITVELVPHYGDFSSRSGPLRTSIRIFDKKNTDETLTITVTATPSSMETGIPVMATSTLSQRSQG